MFIFVFRTQSNLKKIVTISLAVFYLFVASGVFLNLHFCGDHVKKFALYTVNDEEGCCGSEEEEGGGCCKNESSFFKVKDDHHSFGTVKLTQNQIQCVEVIQPELQISLGPDYSLFKETDYDPPVLYDDPLYLKHKVLLI